MSLQSARIFFEGDDHKDIYFRGSYHDAMYVGAELVWRKLASSGVLDIKNLKTAAFCNDCFYFLLTNGNFESTELLPSSRPTSTLLGWIASSRDEKYLYGRNWYGDSHSIFMLSDGRMIYTSLEDMDIFADSPKAVIRGLVSNPYSDSRAVLYAARAVMSKPENSLQIIFDVLPGTEEAGLLARTTTKYDDFSALFLAERPNDIVQIGQAIDRSGGAWLNRVSIVSSAGKQNIIVKNMPDDAYNQWYGFEENHVCGMHGIYFVVQLETTYYLIAVDGIHAAEALNLTEMGVTFIALAASETETRALCNVNGTAEVWQFSQAGSMANDIIAKPDIGTPTGIAYAGGYWFYGGSECCIYTK